MHNAPNTGLWCELTLPFAWKPSSHNESQPALEREALLQLNAINQMEAAHDLESGSDRRMERLEAKLDLTLYLLARTLQPGPGHTPRSVQLSPAGVRWHDATPPSPQSRLILEMQPSLTLPLSLRLPALALSQHDGLAAAQFTSMGEAVLEALHQFVFRRHRQAIRARQG